MAEQSRMLTVERSRTRDAEPEMPQRQVCPTAWLQRTKEHAMVEQGQQGGVQQPGAHTGSDP